MLGWKVEECHEFFAVFLQAQRRLGIFGLVDFDEQIERLFCIIFGLGLPPSRDIAAQCPDGQRMLWIAALAFGCDSLGKQLSTFIVFLLPAALLSGRRIDFIQCPPKPHGTVSDGQLGRVHASIFAVEQNLTPALGGLANPILNCQEPFFATGRDANNHKGAKLVILSAKNAVDAVRCPAGACKACCREGAQI